MKHACEDPQDAGEIEGRYANYLKVGHNAFEFLLDFGQFFPESHEALFHTRIITGPVYAKAFLETLQCAVDRYEQTFEAIPKKDE